MKLDKVKFESIADISYVMRRPFETLSYTNPKELINIMKNEERKITIHQYIPMPRKSKVKDLFNASNSLYQQLYIAIENDNIHYCYSNSTGSLLRQFHNELIDYVIDEKLTKDIKTAVIVTPKHRQVLSYYFHENYAYINHDIGSNYDRSISEKIKNLPYSEWSGGFFDFNEVTFNSKKKILIFRSMNDDILTRKFRKNIQKLGR